MSTFEALSNQLESQFGFGENANRSLASVQDGVNNPYGKLGDFSSEFDHSAERNYLEEGYLRYDPFTTNPKIKEVIWQQPEATVLVKKKMFSALAENYNSAYMDKDEKVFLKASKILFQNKCRQIAAYEKLCKLDKMVEATEKLNSEIIPLLLSLSNNILGDNLIVNDKGGVNRFQQVIEKVRKVYTYNKSSRFTDWVQLANSSSKYTTGDGTGIIELTNFSSIQTQVGVSTGAGTCNITIIDPFGLMRITEHDIELAIADTTNRYYNKTLLTSQALDTDSIINKSINRLNERRKLRGASELSFKINADTLFGKKITVIVDRIGKEILFDHSIGKVEVDQEFLYGGGTLGTDGLIDPKLQPEAIGNNKTRKQYPADKASGISNELDDFKSIISLVYNKIALDSNSKNSIFQKNKETNPLRKKMRMHFLGKLIIQPMDSLHVSFTSRTISDDKIVGGLKSNYTGINVLQKLSNNISEIKNSIQGTILPSGNIDLEAEKAVFVGSAFPSSTWMMVRSLFVSDADGTHCFAGLVNSARLSYNANSGYSVSISCSDNMKYLEMGKVNFNPGADNFAGSLFDPLTPFKTDFESISLSEKDNKRDLLDENKILLSSQMRGIIKHKNGPAAGSAANADNLSQDVTIDKTGKISTKYYAPDGLVYKWKEGISTLVQNGSSFDLYDPSRTGAQKTTAEALAGQDIMNSISLFITGIPYNYATYYKAAIANAGIPTDPDTNKPSASSYYQSLNNELRKRNSLWGNFVPFKNIVMDEESYSKVLSAQFNIQNFSTELDQNLKKISYLKNESNFFLKRTSESSGNKQTELNNAALKINKLKAQGDKISKNLYNSITSQLKVIGNDVSVNNDSLLNDNQGSRNYNNPDVKKSIRRKMNHLTRRFAWAIRANEDKNLFIVDDTYDKDYDIAAFQEKLGSGMALYSSEFLNVKEKVSSVANLLNLEVFCDTQGHIRARPPQYNKIPSSVFYNMMLLKKQKGIEIFPKYLENLYKDQLSALASRIGMLEDELRIMIVLIGKNSSKISNETLEASIKSLTKSSVGGGYFQFLTQMSTGEIFELSNVLNLIPENDKQSKVNFDEVLSKIGNQVSLQSSFTPADRYQFIVSATDIPGIIEGTSLDTIKTRLSSKYGVTVDLSKYTFTTSNGLENLNTVDLYKVTAEIMQKLADRQKLISKLSSSVKNLQEYQSLENGSSVLFNSFSPNKNVPEMLEHMIEDESFDDYGPGSGSRYIIKNKHIISYDSSENPPPYTMVQVNGALSPLGVEGPPALNNSLPGGGNGLTSAVAIDYDMWKIYGMNSSVQPINVPFLNSPETQCAPYAATLLSRNRRNVLRAGMTIVGNEYMQPGEVLYVEQLGLLYYVESVSHSFSYGGSFTTSLVLSYGHTPGEYIPTTLDVIGKLLYNNRDIGSYEINKQHNSFNESHLTSFLITPSERDVFDLTDDNNKKIINALFTSAFTVNSNSAQSNKISSKIELRYYYDSNNLETLYQMKQVAEYIKKVMTGKAGLPPSKINKYTNNLDSVPRFEDKQVEVVGVELDNPTDYQSASQMAWNLARNYLDVYPKAVVARKETNELSSTAIFDKQASLLKDALYGGVIDCYVKNKRL